MPWVVRDVVHDINKAVGRRWQGLDPLLPQPGDLPAGCGAPLVVTGSNGRPAGLGVCLHQHVPADSLSLTWGAAGRFILVPRLREPDTRLALDDLLTQWRDHLTGLEEAHADDTAAMITWPSRDVTGVRALIGHGLQPITVLAARPANRPVPAGAPVTIRRAGPDDLNTVTELEMGVIHWDAQFAGAVPRPSTRARIREQAQASLTQRPAWTWLADSARQDSADQDSARQDSARQDSARQDSAEPDRRPIGLLTVLPPRDAGWVAPMTGSEGPAYLSSMFVRRGERGRGVATALVRLAHQELDVHRVPVTLLDYSQVNPVSGPFWSRMGYRPLWTRWEARPATALR